MARKYLLPILAVGIVYLSGCKDEFRHYSKYDRPSWLAGKIYTQIKTYPELSTFAKCIHLTGYDTIINVSGSYTAFAPNNDAFVLYFQQHSNYKTVEDIPISELSRIVKYHIVQDPWSRDQLLQLDVYGWIDTSDLNNNKPKGYKRETLLREKDHLFGVIETSDKHFIIVDSAASKWHRRQATDSRKYAPIFYQDYFDIYHLTSNDYAFYFDRPFESPNDIYFVNGRIIKSNIFAENGFIHIIDRVVDPLQNAFQILSNTSEHNYTEFLNLVNNFPEFTYNQQATFQQPGAREGLAIDSLFDISYPELAMAINNEATHPPSGTFGLPSNVTIRYHYGLVAPTNAAMDAFIGQYIAGPGHWGSLAEAPRHIRRIIANTHMSAYPIYPSILDKGFENGEQDIVTVSQADIVQKQYASNCTFIGTSKVIVPRAFKSVTGPIYLQKGYSFAMYAIERAGLLPALKRENKDYMVYVEADQNLVLDSSLIYNPLYKSFAAFQISGSSATRVNLTTNDLRILIMNHVGVESPKGIARKEFIQNLAGNFIIYNNITGEVRGTIQTTRGYHGSVQVTVVPSQISTQADNGKTFEISNWFSFGVPTLYSKISTSYPKFQSLLQKAGLTKDKEYRYTFISDNENYTVFVPNDAALNSYNTDTLTNTELQQFLMMHFIQGSLIFTDGHMAPDYYTTTRIDDSSTPFSVINTKIYIQPGPDIITIPDNEGGIYMTVNESSATNIITGRSLGTGNEAFPNIVSNGVIHETGTVLLYSKLKTK